MNKKHYAELISDTILLFAPFLALLIWCILVFCCKGIAPLWWISLLFGAWAIINALLVLRTMEKILIDEDGIHTFVRNKLKREILWCDIQRIEVWGKVLTLVFFSPLGPVNPCVQINIELRKIILEELCAYAPTSVKEMMRMELSRFNIQLPS